MAYMKDLYMDWLDSRQYEDDYVPTADEMECFYDYAMWYAINQKMSRNTKEQAPATTHHPKHT